MRHFHKVRAVRSDWVVFRSDHDPTHPDKVGFGLLKRLRSSVPNSIGTTIVLRVGGSSTARSSYPACVVSRQVCALTLLLSYAMGVGTGTHRVCRILIARRYWQVGSRRTARGGGRLYVQLGHVAEDAAPTRSRSRTVTWAPADLGSRPERDPPALQENSSIPIDGRRCGSLACGGAARRASRCGGGQKQGGRASCRSRCGRQQHGASGDGVEVIERTIRSAERR